MIRTIGERFGGWIGRQHSARGVDTRFGIGIDGLVVGQDGRVSAVNLSDGTQVACDAVVVGIGIVPAVDLARDAGLAIGNGIIVDQQCRTSNPHVFAAGDVADQPDFFGGRTRFETYQNAADQGAVAAAAILGQTPDFCKPCWFWSDQFDINLQVTGRINDRRSEEHTSELQSLMRISYAVFCLKKKKQKINLHNTVYYDYHKSYKSTNTN